MNDSLLNGPYKSRAVAYLRRQGPGVLSAIRVSETMLAVGEILVSLAEIVAVSDDPKLWRRDVCAYFDSLEESIANELLLQLCAKLEDGVDEEAIRAYFARFHGQTYRDFVRRLLGAAGSLQLLRAMREDAAVLALACRKLVRALMPLAVAWTDMVGTLRATQLKKRGREGLTQLDPVELVVSVDRAIGQKVLRRLPQSVAQAQPAKLVAWDRVLLSELIDRFRVSVSASSAGRVERANLPLVRKLTGARDALTFSADGASQAASSLIELIDRIMRESCPPAEVLAWVDSQFEDTAELVHIDREGTRRPTKFAEALCFAYGNGPTVDVSAAAQLGEGGSPFHEAIALAMVEIRNRLQKIKHADSGTPEERQTAASLMTALEGTLLIGLLSAQAAPQRGVPAADDREAAVGGFSIGDVSPE